MLQSCLVRNMLHVLYYMYRALFALLAFVLNAVVSTMTSILEILYDSPLCSCGDIETSEHYFLQCRRYHLQRQEMLNNISQICHVSIEVLLFGDFSLSNDVKQQNILTRAKIYKRL